MRLICNAHPVVIAVALLAGVTFPRIADARTFRCADGDVQCLIFSINQANMNGQPKNTIRLEGNTYPIADIDNNTDGANGLPSITSDLVIVSPQATATITRPAGASLLRFFHVEASGHLTLKDVTISNAGLFAAVFSSGELTIVRSTFTGNGSGAVSNRGGALTITDSAFSGNRDTAVSNSLGVTTVSRSTFENNSGGLSGGAAFENAGGQLTITGCIFKDNIGFVAGAIRSDSGTVFISKSRFADNESVSGTLYMTNGTTSIEKTTFEGNSGEDVGGIRSFGTLIVTDSAFIGNDGDGNFDTGGAIFTEGWAQVTNTTFGRNRRGAVANGGYLILTNTTFADNLNKPKGLLNPLVTTTIHTLSLAAVTILENTILVHAPDEPFVPHCDGPITSLGNNIIDDVTGCDVSLQPGDRTGDAGLDAFVDDGVAGHGHYPLIPASQAIDNANDALCPKKDQIGTVRRRRNCDIGAIEFVPQTLLP